MAIYHLCVQDDHSTVRHAALRTLIAILPDVPLEARATCLPALRPLFSQPPPIVTADPAAAEALADAYAAPMPLPMALRPLSQRDAAMFLGCYCHLALRGSPPARLQCARAFPALLLAICPNGGPGPQRAPLLDVFTRLSADTMARPCVLTSNANSHMQSCRTQMCHNASIPTLTQPGAKNGRPWPAHSPLSPRTLW